LGLGSVERHQRGGIDAAHISSLDLPISPLNLPYISPRSPTSVAASTPHLAASRFRVASSLTLRVRVRGRGRGRAGVRDRVRVRVRV
jgi:hypothetical protein